MKNVKEYLEDINLNDTNIGSKVGNLSAYFSESSVFKIPNMRNIEMLYLDIVTGERVIDRASHNQYGGCFDYQIEFVDDPNYQTDDYQNYVTLTGGQGTTSVKNINQNH